MGVQINGSEGNVIATKGTFSGDVGIGGTLTYEDVTNIDSVGLITARSGIEIGASPGVAASISVDGNMIVSGISTFGGDVQVPDKIIHSGDTNTAIRFPSADTITAETGGSERVRITSGGNVNIGGNYDETSHPLNVSDATKPSLALHTGTALRADLSATSGICSIRSYANNPFTINTGGSGETEALRIKSDGDVIIGGSSDAGYTNYADNLTIHGTSNEGITIRSGNTSGASQGAIYFADATGDVTGAYEGYLIYDHNGDHLRFGTNHVERLRIHSTGHVTKPSTAMFSARGQDNNWHYFNGGNGWYNLGDSSYSGSNYYLDHGWTTSGSGCGVRGVLANGNSVWENDKARFTAPVDGFYTFEMSLYIRAFNGGHTFHLQPWIDSANTGFYTSNIGIIRDTSDGITGNTPEYPHVHRAITIYMSASQTFRWVVYADGTNDFQTYKGYAHQSGFLVG